MKRSQINQEMKFKLVYPFDACGTQNNSRTPFQLSDELRQRNQLKIYTFVLCRSNGSVKISILPRTHKRKLDRRE